MPIEKIQDARSYQPAHYFDPFYVIPGDASYTLEDDWDDMKHEVEKKLAAWGVHIMNVDFEGDMLFVALVATHGEAEAVEALNWLETMGFTIGESVFQ